MSQREIQDLRRKVEHLETTLARLMKKLDIDYSDLPDVEDDEWTYVDLKS